MRLILIILSNNWMGNNDFVCLFEALCPGQQFFSHFGTASWV